MAKLAEIKDDLTGFSTETNKSTETGIMKQVAAYKASGSALPFSDWRQLQELKEEEKEKETKGDEKVEFRMEGCLSGSPTGPVPSPIQADAPLPRPHIDEKHILQSSLLAPLPFVIREEKEDGRGHVCKHTVPDGHVCLCLVRYKKIKTDKPIWCPTGHKLPRTGVLCNCAIPYNLEETKDIIGDFERLCNCANAGIKIELQKKTLVPLGPCGSHRLQTQWQTTREVFFTNCAKAERALFDYMNELTKRGIFDAVVSRTNCERFVHKGGVIDYDEESAKSDENYFDPTKRVKVTRITPNPTTLNDSKSADVQQKITPKTPPGMARNPYTFELFKNVKND